MSKAQIAIISASTRKHRLSHRVSLHLKQHLSGIGYQTSLVDLNEFKIPLFEETIDKLDEPNDGLNEINKIISQADAIIFISPEYNGSYTSALKNLVDHYPKSVFHRKPMGAVSVTTGALGGMRCAMQLHDLSTALYGLTLPQALLVPQVHKKFDIDGTLIDKTFIKNIELFLNDFLWLTDLTVGQRISFTL
jgi:NAD(P)H-dependent FMN reductase